MTKVVKEIGSGVNDARPKFGALLEDPSIGILIVEHQDRATRFGFRYSEAFCARLYGQGRAKRKTAMLVQQLQGEEDATR